MSFDKEYPNRKDHRKSYKTKAEQIDRSCRPGGSDPHSQRSRQINKIKLKLKAQSDIEVLAEDLSSD